MIRYFKPANFYSFRPPTTSVSTFSLIAKARRHSKDFNLLPGTGLFPQKSELNIVWGIQTPFIKNLVVRGIGYRLLLIEQQSADSKQDIDNFFKWQVNQGLLTYSSSLIKSIGDTVVTKNPITNRPYTKWKQLYERYYTQREDNSFLDEYRSFHDLPFAKFLIVRVGHTIDTVIPLTRWISIKRHKKERKISIYGPSKAEVGNLAKMIYKLRKPSPYTGRGVKFKHIKVQYKKVRKTKAGGRAF